jgi:hypothetical protein
MRFGEKIRELRLTTGLDQPTLAQKWSRATPTSARSRTVVVLGWLRHVVDPVAAGVVQGPCRRAVAGLAGRVEI